MSTNINLVITKPTGNEPMFADYKQHIMKYLPLDYVTGIFLAGYYFSQSKEDKEILFDSFIEAIAHRGRHCKHWIDPNGNPQSKPVDVHEILNRTFWDIDDSNEWSNIQNTILQIFDSFEKFYKSNSFIHSHLIELGKLYNHFQIVPSVHEDGIRLHLVE